MALALKNHLNPNNINLPFVKNGILISVQSGLRHVLCSIHKLFCNTEIPPTAHQTYF